MTPADPAVLRDELDARLVDTIAGGLWFDEFAHSPRCMPWAKAVSQAAERGPESAAAEQVDRFRYRARALLAGPLATFRADLAARDAEIEGLTTPRPLAEWHEDHGFVLWWILPVCEPPYSGSPLCDNWPGYHTHWTSLPEIRAALTQGGARV